MVKCFQRSIRRIQDGSQIPKPNYPRSSRGNLLSYKKMHKNGLISFQTHIQRQTHYPFLLGRELKKGCESTSTLIVMRKHHVCTCYADRY